MRHHIAYRTIAELAPYARNARTHSDAQLAQLASAIEEFGWTNPVLADAQGIVAGHGRVMAAQRLYARGLTIRHPGGGEIPTGTVPVIDCTGWSDTQRRAYILADNQLALQAGWDETLLAQELADLQALDCDLGLTGFGDDELSRLLAGLDATTQGHTDDDHIPEASDGSEPVTRAGDIWLLGKHRVMCGDSIIGDDIARLMNGRKAALLHADPPYGMGKEGDGVANDNLYREKLDAFQMDWWAEFRPFIEDNASAYIWGNAPDLWRLWYRGGLEASERITLRNEIVWGKIEKEGAPINARGMSSDELRMYAPATERCLFFMLGEQGFNNNADNYWNGFEPIRAYLDGERTKMGWGSAEIKTICGVGMFSHWFTRSQWTFITAEHYEKLKASANGEAFRRDYDALRRDYDALRRDYDAHRRDFYTTRAHFDNTHDNMNDIWLFVGAKGEERHGHATPKPVAMMERVMRSSLPPGGLCAEPFGGSGSTLIGAEKTGRVCYSMELQPRYVDTIVRRWQQFTGKRATLEATGAPFPAEAVEA